MIDPSIIDAMVAAGASAEVIAAAFKADHAIETDRLAARREKATERKRRSRAASRDVTPGHAMSHQNSVTDADPLPPSVSPSPFPPITPLPLTPSTPPDPKSSLRSLDRSRDPFDDFWEIYPKRDGSNPKHLARKRFVAALKSGVELETIITGARTYAAECRTRSHVGTPYVAQAATWLNQRRWGDSTPPPSTATTGGWRPGLPTDAELRAKYARKPDDKPDSDGRAPTADEPAGEAPGRAGDAEKLLREGEGVHRTEQLGVRGQMRQRGAQSLGDVLSRSLGLDAGVSEDARGGCDRGDDGPSPMAAVVRS